ncbi:MAG: glycosyltransferase, partial [Pyrinomonadaceae bacterium]
VQQDLLPFLWLGGHLGGRTFDVLMTAMPMIEIQKRLDIARSLHPESKTLGDFRADARLLAAENSALENARKLITPHSAIAGMFPKRAVLLDWKDPARSKAPRRQNPKPVVVFPASTVGRKGCYELREALTGLDVKLIRLGPEIEGDNFWHGFDTERGGNDMIAMADLVVLPAHVEHRPRRLLMAAASGIPVIASTACGISNVRGVEFVETGDVSALRDKIGAALSMALP